MLLFSSELLIFLSLIISAPLFHGYDVCKLYDSIDLWRIGWVLLKIKCKITIILYIKRIKVG